VVALEARRDGVLGLGLGPEVGDAVLDLAGEQGRDGRAVGPTRGADGRAGVHQTLKIEPRRLPIIIEAPMSVTVSSVMPHTPMAEAMYCPSPRRSESS